MGATMLHTISKLGLTGLPVLMLVGCPQPQAPILPNSGVSAEVFARGLNAPLALAHAGDGSGRLFVAGQQGTISVLDRDGNRADALFLDIRERVIPLSTIYDESGLLGLAFHPNFKRNGRFFVCYNGETTDAVAAGSDSELRVAEFQVSIDDPNLANADSERVLLRIGKPQGNHNGGALAFGRDGYLYFSVGDGGGGGDTGSGHTPEIGNAQDLATLLGKIGRIDVDAGDPYAIPADNPFVDVADARPEIFALGFRNPWRISFDRVTGDLYVGDVGQGVREEVDVVTRGGNYGWRIREGLTCYNVAASGQPLDSCAISDGSGRPLVDPILEYSHTVGVSVIGGYQYRGQRIQSLAGRYVFGDFNGGGTGLLFSGTENGDSWSFEELALEGFAGGRLGQFIFAFGEGEDGELYILSSASFSPTSDEGSVYKIVPTFVEPE